MMIVIFYEKAHKEPSISSRFRSAVEPEREEANSKLTRKNSDLVKINYLGR